MKDNETDGYGHHYLIEIVSAFSKAEIIDRLERMAWMRFWGITEGSYTDYVLKSLPASVGERERDRERQPRIICLCGSTEFIEQFAIKTWELEREGYIVLGCTLLPMWYCKVPSHFGEASGTKEQCDELHLRKIDLADEVLVLNYEGYIGESTRREIEYATATGKPVRYVEEDPNGK